MLLHLMILSFGQSLLIPDKHKHLKKLQNHKNNMAEMDIRFVQSNFIIL